MARAALICFHKMLIFNLFFFRFFFGETIKTQTRETVQIFCLFARAGRRAVFHSAEMLPLLVSVCFRLLTQSASYQ